MSELLDFSDTFRRRPLVDRENLPPQMPFNVLQEKTTRNDPNNNTHDLSLACDRLARRCEGLDKESELNKEVIFSIKQELNVANNKIAALNKDQRTLRVRWLEEKNDLESKVFQLIAAQTQYQGTIRKKDKDIEKLQALLQKQIKDTSNKTTVLAKIGSTKTMTITPNNNISNSGIVITKPLPSNLSQAQQSSAVEVTQNLLKDAEVAALRRIAADAQFETAALRLKLASMSSTGNTSVQPVTATAEGLPEVAALQRRVMELEQKLTLTADAHRANVPTGPLLCAIPVTAPTTALTSAVDQGPTKELERDLREQLKRAWMTINEQDALVHQALIGKLRGMPELLEGCLDSSNEGISTHSLHSPYLPVNKRRRLCNESAAVTGGTWTAAVESEEEEEEECMFTLPPASPATIALLKGYGWTDLPPLEQSEE